jgi:hypothetical protein
VHFGRFGGIGNETIYSSSDTLSPGAAATVAVPARTDVNIWYRYTEGTTNWYIRLVDDDHATRAFDVSDGAHHTLELRPTGYLWDFNPVAPDAPENDEKVMTPEILPDQATISTVDEITILSNTTGAEIYYTTDGSTPFSSLDPLYTGPIVINTPGTVTVKAKAYKSGLEISDVASRTYTVTEAADTPDPDDPDDPGDPPGGGSIVADAGSDANITVGTTVSLDASATTYDGQASLTYTWSVTAKPFGSTAEPVPPTGTTSSFTPDITGRYTLEVSVSDGVNTETATVDLGVHNGYNELAGTIVDAEYDEVNERIILVTTSPNALLIHVPSAASTTSVPLSYAPTAVSVSPDGSHAAVGHDPTGAGTGAVTRVNLGTQSANVMQIPSNSTSYHDDWGIYDVALDDDGYVYITTKQDQWTQMAVLNTATEATSRVTDRSIYHRTRILLSPAGTKLYTIDTSSFPRDTERWSISSGTVTYDFDSQYHGGAYKMGDNGWFSEDGYLLHAHGALLYSIDETASDNSGDMLNNASPPMRGLSGGGSLIAADHSAEAGYYLAVRTHSTDESIAEAIRSYGDETYAIEREWYLPLALDGGTGYKTRGRFVFFREDGDAVYVVVEAESSYGGASPFAVVTYDASELQSP